MDATELSRRFGLGGAARLSDGPVARGKQGDVWRLDTDDARWAVKAPYNPIDEAEVETAAAFQEAAHAAGVPTPQVRRTTDGEACATLGGLTVRVYEWVDLGAPDELLDPAVVGSVVAGIHRTSMPAEGSMEPWFCAPVGEEGWDLLVERLIEAGAPFADRLAELRDELVALESWLEPPERLQTCHRDLWADNVLPTADGGVCVIDWENSGPADPDHELGYVLFEFTRSDPGRTRAFLDAYRAAGGPGRVSRRGHFSMLIAIIGHVTELAGNDWLVPNRRSPSRVDSAAWIGLTLDEPPTRAVLDDLLAAAQG